jgi:hypothetical protein
VEFNAQMSRKDVARALLQLLPNQFKEPPKVAAEFGKGYVAPAEGAKRTIAGRFIERVLGNEDLDVGFSLWTGRRPCTTSEGCGDGCGGRTTSVSPLLRDQGLRQPPLLVSESEEYLDAQGLEPIGLEGLALGEYMAQLEEAIRTWWRAVGPADNLPYQHGRLMDPSGPGDGERWPSKDDNFVASYIRRCVPWSRLRGRSRRARTLQSRHGAG